MLKWFWLVLNQKGQRCQKCYLPLEKKQRLIDMHSQTFHSGQTANRISSLYRYLKIDAHFLCHLTEKCQYVCQTEQEIRVHFLNYHSEQELAAWGYNQDVLHSDLLYQEQEEPHQMQVDLQPVVLGKRPHQSDEVPDLGLVEEHSNQHLNPEDVDTYFEDPGFDESPAKLRKLIDEREAMLAPSTSMVDLSPSTYQDPVSDKAERRRLVRERNLAHMA